MLIDSHSHLHFHKEFPDFEEVIERAEAAGVIKQVLIGCEMRDSLRAMAFAQEKEGMNWTIGIHPHESQEISVDNLKTIREVLEKKGDFTGLVKGPVAMGEIGLDYVKSAHAPDVQQRGLRELLEIAMEFDLPVVAHVREAFDDASKIFRESGVKKLVLHCFSGGMKEADWAWGKGFMTSFTGIVTYPKNTILMEVVKNAPADLFMLETDCPYLAPQAHRGKRNEPAFVRDIAAHVAELRHVSLDQIARTTTANAEAFFGI